MSLEDMVSMGRTLSVAVLVWCGLAGPVRGQMQHAQQRHRAMRQSPRLSLGSDLRRRDLSSYQSHNYQGIQTRSDRIEQILRLTQPSSRIGRETSIPDSPIERLLEQRNLLRPRSPLAREGEIKSDLYGYLLEQSSPWRPPAQTPDMATNGLTPLGGFAEPNGGKTLVDRMVDRLSEQGRNYFRVGAAYFRERDLIRAAGQFEQLRVIEYDSAQPLVALGLVAFERHSFSLAGAFFRQAVDRARSLDDLQIDVDALYADRAAFDRSVTLARRMASNQPDSSTAQMLYAILAWLNGDLRSAQSAATAALNGVEDTDSRSATSIRTFLNLLVAQDASPKKGP